MKAAFTAARELRLHHVGHLLLRAAILAGGTLAVGTVFVRDGGILSVPALVLAMSLVLWSMRNPDGVAPLLGMGFTAFWFTVTLPGSVLELVAVGTGFTVWHWAAAVASTGPTYAVPSKAAGRALVVRSVGFLAATIGSALLCAALSLHPPAELWWAGLGAAALVAAVLWISFTMSEAIQADHDGGNR